MVLEALWYSVNRAITSFLLARVSPTAALHNVNRSARSRRSSTGIGVERDLTHTFRTMTRVVARMLTAATAAAVVAFPACTTTAFVLPGIPAVHLEREVGRPAAPSQPSDERYALCVHVCIPGNDLLFLAFAVATRFRVGTAVLRRRFFCCRTERQLVLVDVVSYYGYDTRINTRCLCSGQTQTTTQLAPILPMHTAAL